MGSRLHNVPNAGDEWCRFGASKVEQAGAVVVIGTGTYRFVERVFFP